MLRNALPRTYHSLENEYNIMMNRYLEVTRAWGSLMDLVKIIRVIFSKYYTVHLYFHLWSMTPLNVAKWLEIVGTVNIFFLLWARSCRFFKIIA